MRSLGSSEPLQHRLSRSPTVRSSVPSRANSIRPGLAPKVPHASATKSSLKSTRESPRSVPRPTAIVFPRGPYFGKLRYTSRLVAKPGCNSMKCNPSGALLGGGDPAGGAGASQAGLGSRTPFRMIRRRPGRSVTRIVLASGNARLNGCTSPPATSVTLMRWPVSVSKMRAPSGAGGGVGADPCAIARACTRTNTVSAASCGTDLRTVNDSRSECIGRGWRADATTRAIGLIMSRPCASTS